MHLDYCNGDVDELRVAVLGEVERRLSTMSEDLVRQNAEAVESEKMMCIPGPRTGEYRKRK